MNIAIVHFNPMNPIKGGVERVSCYLSEELENLGHKTIFISTKPMKDDFPEQYKEKQLVLDNAKILSQTNIKVFKEILEENDIDIILNQNGGQEIGITELCKASITGTNIKLVSVLHINPDSFLKSSFYNCLFLNIKSKKGHIILIKTLLNNVRWPIKRTQLLKKYKIIYSSCYHNSDAMVLLSKNFIDSFIKLSGIKSSNKLTAISNPLVIDESIKIEKKTKKIIFIGRLAMQHKRPDRIIRIWNKLYDKYTDWELQIIGEGEALDDLKDLVKRYKMERVSFEGYKPPNPYYKEADIICLTSDYEGFGMVLTEAMQYGVVPIAYESYESLKDIISDGINGYCIKAFDQKKFISKIELLINNPSLKHQISETAKKSVERFDVRSIAKEWENLFNQVLDNKTY